MAMAVPYMSRLTEKNIQIQIKPRNIQLNKPICKYGCMSSSGSKTIAVRHELLSFWSSKEPNLRAVQRTEDSLITTCERCL